MRPDVMQDRLRKYHNLSRQGISLLNEAEETVPKGTRERLLQTLEAINTSANAHSQTSRQGLQDRVNAVSRHLLKLNRLKEGLIQVPRLRDIITDLQRVEK